MSGRRQRRGRSNQHLHDVAKRMAVIARATVALCRIAGKPPLHEMSYVKLGIWWVIK